MKKQFSQLTYLVGHSRGGTTWLGELLSLHPEVGYIFEPFASQAHPYTGIDMQTLFNNGRRYQHLKRGDLLKDYPSQKFFNMDPDEPELKDYVGLIQEHLKRLVAHYFPNQNGFHLIIKQPRMENLGWTVKTLEPDHVVLLERHPFGVIASYHNNNFWYWLDLEWPLAKKSVPQTHPQWAYLFEGGPDHYEQELILSYIRSKVVADYCKGTEVIQVKYEQLCYNPSSHLKGVMQALGLEWTPLMEELLEQKVSDSVPKGIDFLDTRKDPKIRAEAWRTELPVKVIERLTQFVQEKKIDVPCPGFGLPPLTPEEMNQSNRFNRNLKFTKWIKKFKRLAFKVTK